MNTHHTYVLINNQWGSKINLITTLDTLSKGIKSNWIKRQFERSRKIIRPLRIRQLIEQFILKVINDQGTLFEINKLDIKKFNLEAEDLVCLKEA